LIQTIKDFPLFQKYLMIFLAELVYYGDLDVNYGTVVINFDIEMNVDTKLAIDYQNNFECEFIERG